MTKLASRVVLAKIKEHVCYTELVYQRVNKKLAVDLSKAEVEALVIAVLDDDVTDVEKLGKNYYVTNSPRQVQLVINSFNNRLITVNRVVEIEAKILLDPIRGANSIFAATLFFTKVEN